MRQYSREDVDYTTFYPQYMKTLALTKTREELEKMIGIESGKLSKATKSHLLQIQKSTGMQARAQGRAQARGSVDCHSSRVRGAEGAIEIYDLFPEFTKECN